VVVRDGILDPATGTLTYSNAGHNPPYLVSARDGAAIQELENTGPPLGLRMFEDITWEQAVAQIAPGDTLVLYTDGVTEAQDAQEELFEEERLMGVVRANLGRLAPGGRSHPDGPGTGISAMSPCRYDPSIV
jgi:sigma-B regulation protein RsbU (phosphoserine phosphatase)